MPTAGRRRVPLLPWLAGQTAASGSSPGPGRACMRVPGQLVPAPLTPRQVGDLSSTQGRSKADANACRPRCPLSHAPALHMALQPQVGDLSNTQVRFKVDVNARENHMTGCSLAVAGGAFGLVVVEGTEKTLRRRGPGRGAPERGQGQGRRGGLRRQRRSGPRIAASPHGQRSPTPAALPLPTTSAAPSRYEKLMLRRIDWNAGREEEEEAEAEGGKPPRPPNYCHLVWQVRRGAAGAALARPQRG